MLRVRVEVVPHGVEAAAQILDEGFAGNDGTGIRGGPNAGGTGNYDLYSKDPRGAGYPRSERPGYLGRLEGLERTPAHRLTLARTILQRMERDAAS